MEAAWLSAVLLVPVFFDIYTSRIFEPDKIALLRTLAWVILAAWVVKLFEQGGFHWDHFTPVGGWLRSLLRLPLLVPVLALVIITIIATILSVSPLTSLLGSYQRLQGTYTTFSYLIVFASLVANLRRSEQLERLVSVAILSSLPVSMYGILQHYGADPVPWQAASPGRVSANLGNPIFVAAYLIMVLPLTLMRVIGSFESILVDRQRTLPNFVRTTVYLIVLALQAITIFFSGSRGPWLGMGVSLVIIGLGVTWIWRKRWMTISGIIIALLVGAFLVVLNIPGGPFERLRYRSEFGRLGQLLDAESRTGKVRTLIWQGAVELVLPHAPLEYPDGHQDPLNFLRPWIGYGPESMDIAYNRFYPTQLALFEKRDTLPDRSHNETWDALITTGGLGLVAYLTLFGSILYFGLKWLGLVSGKKERTLFLTLYLGCGLLSAIGFALWMGVEYLGVALPFGMILGVILYLVWVSLFKREQAKPSKAERLRLYLMLGLLAAITAHFLEINFGIAISATRTYFWVYAGLLLLAGYILPRQDEFARNNASPAAPAPGGNVSHSKKNRELKKVATTSRRSLGDAPPTSFTPWKREGMILGLITGLLLTTLGFSFFVYTGHPSSALGLIVDSLTQTVIPGTRNGILPLILVTWLVGILLLASESIFQFPELERSRQHTWLKMIGLGAAISAGLALIFWWWNATNLVKLAGIVPQSMDEILDQVRGMEGILTTYSLHVFSIVFGLAIFLPENWPTRQSRVNFLGQALASAMLILAFLLSNYSNLRVIQADVAFKAGQIFAGPDGWEIAIAIYDRANRLALNEDHYYLYLGHAYMEYVKTIDDDASRDELFKKADLEMRKAQEINPLNPEHTANLARFYTLWTTFSDDPGVHQQYAMTADQYFTSALALSPKNVKLLNERAVLYLKALEDPERAFELLQSSLQIDPDYDWTYALIADYYQYTLAVQNADQAQKERAALEAAAQNYQAAFEHGKGHATLDSLFSYAIALGKVDARLGWLDQAIQAYQNALEYQPDSADNWQVNLDIARLYAQQQDNSHALEFAQKALSQAPEDQQQIIKDLMAQWDK
jgi:tetratricopeptide (TPR) repeat protein/O-antigen ligase